jgi:4-hydroxy-2-oxoheptanedioate aldolase
MTGRIRAAVTKHQPCVGVWHLIQDLAVSELLRETPVDFLTLDLQHHAATIEGAQRAMIALRGSGLDVLVRMRSHDPAAIGQVLDCGADGVVVPMVDTAEQVAAVVAASRYPPDGVRSWDPHRAMLAYADLDDYVDHAGDALVVVQVETTQAVEAIDDIVAVPGLGAVMVGPGDLAVSMGYIREPGHPAVAEAAEHVLNRCRLAGVPFGMFTGSPEEAASWIERGALLVNCGADVGWVLQGARALGATLGQAIPPETVAAPTGRDPGQ